MSAIKRGEPEEPVAIGALPRETLSQIFEALDSRSLGRAARTCRLWRDLVFPIARPPRFREPGFALIASDDFVATKIVICRDMFASVRGCTVKICNARGEPMVYNAALYESPSVAGRTLSVRGGRKYEFRTREYGTSDVYLAKEAEPFDLALTVEMEFPEVAGIGLRAIRVLTPEREVLFEVRGRAFAILGDVIAIAEDERVSFWSCAK